jgi:RNA polymerase-binding transcription factor DksA
LQFLARTLKWGCAADADLSPNLLGSDDDALAQIEAAIERIDDGSYGQCEECGGEDPRTRSDTIPCAAMCATMGKGQWAKSQMKKPW